MNNILTISCIASLILLAPPAHADTIALQFSGSITQVSVDDAFGDIAFGDTFHGTLTFDSTAADLIPADPSIGNYAWNSPFGMTVSIDGHEFDASGSLTIGVLDSFVDQYTVFATSQTGDLDLELFLLDTTGSAFSNDHLPLSLSALAGFAERDFQLNGFLPGGAIELSGEMDAPSTQEVPEPSSFLQLAIPVLALARLRRRI